MSSPRGIRHLSSATLGGAWKFHAWVTAGVNPASSRTWHLFDWYCPFVVNVDATAHDRLRLLMTGYRVTHLIAVAVRLKIPDHLAAGPCSAEELASEDSLHVDSLHRVLRGLAAFDVLKETLDGRFELGPLGGLLRQDTPDSLAPLVLMLMGPSFAAWREIEHTVRTGSTAFSKLYGHGEFQELAGDASFAQAFNAAMVGISLEHSRQLVEVYDFTGVGLAADIGGGSGTLIATVLAAHPQMRGILFDQPAGLGQARMYLGSEGVLEKCQVVEGDFFDSVPAGADLYFLKQVLHDWGDEDCARILVNCARAMGRGARLLVIERQRPTTIRPVVSDQLVVMIDLHMMVALGGRERTLEEYQSLIEAAGLRFKRAIPLPHGPTVFEAIKP